MRRRCSLGSDVTIHAAYISYPNKCTWKLWQSIYIFLKKNSR